MGSCAVQDTHVDVLPPPSTPLRCKIPDLEPYGATSVPKAKMAVLHPLFDVLDGGTIQIATQECTPQAP